ncbi:MAG: GlxA family transcriptional regulator [Pseudomonadota bacterium]
MQSSTKNDRWGASFDILLFPSFSNHCLANLVEPLRAANTLSRTDFYHWRFLTMDGAPVESSSGLQVAPHAALGDGGGDSLVVMPSYGFRDLDRGKMPAQMRQAARRYRCLIGMDTGSWLLARAGLLDDRRATIHWEELTGFAEAFPQVDVVRERYVLEGDRITCSGAMAAFDLVLHMIGVQHGALLAVEVAQLFMTRDSARSHASAPRGSRIVDRALTIMQAHLEDPLTIGQVAKQLGVTQKRLETRMQAEMQCTPQQMYRRLRLNLARKLVLDTDLSVSEIALRSGYENASAMTRAYRSEFAQTPRDMRTAAL